MLDCFGGNSKFINRICMSKIIVVGSSNTDMVVHTSHLPAPGETILGGKFLMNQGGKGANQAVAVKRLGGDLLFVARVGNDVLGQQTLRVFQNEGIETSYIALDNETPSGVALISVDQYAENCIVVASGANMLLGQEDIDSMEKEMLVGDILLMQLEIPLSTVEYAARKAYEKGVKVVLNPAPACSLPESLFQYLYMITPNRIEAEMLTGISWSSLGGLKGVKPPEAFGERSRDWSLGHAGDEGPHLSMTGESRGCSRAAAPVCGFSRGTTARSVSLSWGAREVGSPCEWRGAARHCSRAMVGESGLETC